MNRVRKQTAKTLVNSEKSVEEPFSSAARRLSCVDLENKKTFTVSGECLDNMALNSDTATAKTPALHLSNSLEKKFPWHGDLEPKRQVPILTRSLVRQNAT